MDLFCPHCTRRVTVSDDTAGQVASCPLCAKKFMAPTLAAPPAPKPPAPPPAPASTFSVAPPPPEPAPVLSNAPPPVHSSSIVYPTKDGAKASAEGGDGQYTRSMQLTLSASWLAFLPTLCVGLIFVLSFFPWHYHVGAIPQTGAAKKQASDGQGASASLWTLAYSDAGIRPTYLAFVLLLVGLMLATPLIAVMDLSRGKLPAKTDSLVKWAHLGLTMLFLAGFFLLLVSWFLVHFVIKNDAIGIGLECALRLQFAGMCGCAGLFWLSKRKPADLPLPRMKIRW